MTFDGHTMYVVSPFREARRASQGPWIHELPDGNIKHFQCHDSVALQAVLTRFASTRAPEVRRALDHDWSFRRWKTHELPDVNIMYLQWPRFGCTGGGVAHKGSDCVETSASDPGYKSSNTVVTVKSSSSRSILGSAPGTASSCRAASLAEPPAAITSPP